MNTSKLVVPNLEIVVLLVAIAVAQMAKTIDDPETTITRALGTSNFVQKARSKPEPRGKLKLPIQEFSSWGGAL